MTLVLQDFMFLCLEKIDFTTLVAPVGQISCCDFFFFLKSIDFSHLMFCCPEQNMSWAASGKPRRKFSAFSKSRSTPQWHSL